MGAANVSMADIVCPIGSGGKWCFRFQQLDYVSFCLLFHLLPWMLLPNQTSQAFSQRLHWLLQAWLDQMPLLTVWWAQVAQLAEVRREDAPEESAQTIPFRRGDAWCKFITMRWEQCCTRHAIFGKHPMIDVVTAISAIFSKRPCPFKSIFKVSETFPGLCRSHASGWCPTSWSWWSWWSWSRSSPQSWQAEIEAAVTCRYIYIYVQKRVDDYLYKNTRQKPMIPGASFNWAGMSCCMYLNREGERWRRFCQLSSLKNDNPYQVFPSFLIIGFLQGPTLQLKSIAFSFFQTVPRTKPKSQTAGDRPFGGPVSWSWAFSNFKGRLEG